jgi:hypothetical protein
MTWSTGRVIPQFFPLALVSLLTRPTVLAGQITSVTRPPPVIDSSSVGEPASGYQAREGLWLGGGLGYGSLRASNSGGIGGVTGTLEAGWTLSRRFLLGVGTSAWYRSVEFDTRPIGVTVGSFDVRARWYPSEMAGNFFLTGAVGMGFIRFSDSEARPTSETLTGRAVRAGWATISGWPTA